MAKATYLKPPHTNYRPIRLELTGRETEYLHRLLGRHITGIGEAIVCNYAIFRAIDSVAAVDESDIGDLVTTPGDSYQLNVSLATLDTPDD